MGNTFYSKILNINLNIDHYLFGNFLSSIQEFLTQIDVDNRTGIKSMKVNKFHLKFRSLEKYSFVGLIDPNKESKKDELVLEYLIFAFLSIFREELKRGLTGNPSIFSKFDRIFKKYKNAKRKKLEKMLKKLPSTYLQQLLNRLKHYLPPSEIIMLNPEKLSIVGKDLIWVSLHLTEDEEELLLKRLKEKIIPLYGQELLENIDLNIRKQKPIKFKKI
jgi:hypothetical protein